RSIIEISDDLLDPPRAEELEITPDGAYAFIRQFNTADIKLVDLSSDEVTALPVAVNPTDLDLTPDGSEAVVVDRGAGQLWIYPTVNPESAIAEVIDLPEDELIGSMQFSPDSSKAILYTTAASVSHYTTWDLEEPDPAESLTVRPLVKPVKSVSITPNGGGLVVFHSDDSGEDSDPAYAGKHALTLIDLDDFLDNPMILPGEPTAYAASSSGDVGYYIMEGEKTLTMVIFDALLHQDIPLKSTPVHVGVLPDTHYAYVNQEHDLGRLTFYDPVNPLEALDDVVKTITGFELNSATEHHE
ncbi:MAG: WD40 repeat domain-containing protein, partial [Myxococcota bacterium]|nr:WD40 repeat domain-containing protein [Myxococcota bacterium]